MVTAIRPETVSEVSARRLAEAHLVQARRAADRAGELLALGDLGLALIEENDGARAVAVLEEALALLSGLGEESREGEFRSNLGLAVRTIGDYDRAHALFQ